MGHSYRSHVPIEPYLSDQWYVKVTDDRLRGAALRAMHQPQDLAEHEQARRRFAVLEAVDLFRRVERARRNRLT
mgnify:CR=1 FL=1